METHSLEKAKSLPKNKEEIKSFAASIARALEEGDINPLELLRNFKAFEKVIESVKPVLDKHAILEAEKFHSKDEITTYAGVKFTLAELGTKYNYENCGDPVWQRLKAAAESASIALKDRETFLKALKDSIEVVDEDSGEICKIHPPLRSSTTGVKTTFL